MVLGVYLSLKAASLIDFQFTGSFGFESAIIIIIYTICVTISLNRLTVTAVLNPATQFYSYALSYIVVAISDSKISTKGVAGGLFAIALLAFRLRLILKID